MGCVNWHYKVPVKKSLYVKFKKFLSNIILGTVNHLQRWEEIGPLGRKGVKKKKEKKKRKRRTWERKKERDCCGKVRNLVIKKSIVVTC